MIQVVIASIRTQRMGEHVAQWFVRTVRQHTGRELSVIDLRTFDLPMFTDAIVPSTRTEPHPDHRVRQWLSSLNDSDGLIFVNPEYNYGLASGLKNGLDYVAHELDNKPVGIVSYGGTAAGIRSSLMLRETLKAFNVHDIGTQVAIPRVWEAFDENGRLLSGNDQAEELAVKMVEELEKLVECT